MESARSIRHDRPPFDYFHYYIVSKRVFGATEKKEKFHGAVELREPSVYESTFDVCARSLEAGTLCRRRQRFRGDVVSCCRRLSREPAHTPVTNDRLLYYWRNFFYFRVQILTFFFHFYYSSPVHLTPVQGMPNRSRVPFSSSIVAIG